MRRVALALLMIACAATAARAQTAPIERGRFEAGIGPLWIGPASFGTAHAAETDANGAAVNLFSAATALNSATGIEARLGTMLTPRVDVEAVGSYAGPHLVTTIRDDVEAGAGPIASEEWIQQFTVGGAVVWKLSALRSHPRLVPFVTAGAQYMRQLHEHETLLVAGRAYDAGGGVKILLGSRDRARLKTAGVRVDVRAIVRTAGVNTDGRAHVSPAIAASLFVRF